MREVFATYPYLLLSLTLAVVAAGLVVVLPSSRPRAVTSGLMAMPSSLLTFVFVPAYWRPTRLVDFKLGAEDLLFSFATGVIVWVFAEECSRGRFVFDRVGRRAVFRHLSNAAVFMAVFLPAAWLGVAPMDATMLGAAAVAVRLLGPARGLWRLAWTAVLGFPLLYLLVLKAVLLAYPESFLGSWNLDALWGLQLAGIPAEEVAWAVAFGTLWPLAVAYAFGARRRENAARQR